MTPNFWPRCQKFAASGEAERSAHPGRVALPPLQPHVPFRWTKSIDMSAGSDERGSDTDVAVTLDNYEPHIKG